MYYKSYTITVPITGTVEITLSATSEKEALELFNDIDHSVLPIDDFNTNDSEVEVDEV